MTAPDFLPLPLRRPAHTVRYASWILSGRAGKSLPQRPWPTLTVLIAYYHPIRSRHVEPQVRNLLRCPFVGKVVVLNDNPSLRLDPRLTSLDDRVVVVNQDVRHGCSYRWVVASEFDPEYLLVIDDDLLLFPRQVEALFEALLADPDVPHGFAGMQRADGDRLDYVQRRDVTVHYLTEVYALTRKHLARYHQLYARLEASLAPAECVTMPGDFVVINRSGSRPPRIHRTGRLLRCPSFKQPGIAIHQSASFWDKVARLERLLDAVQPAPRKPGHDDEGRGGRVG